MILRLGFVVVASVAAFAIKQQVTVQGSKSRNPQTKDLDTGDRNSEDGVKVHEVHKREEKKEEEEEEEVKLISSIFDRVKDSPSTSEDNDYLPEFENLLSGEIDYPPPVVRFNISDRGKTCEVEMKNYADELQRLRDMVMELEEREVKLESELLEYYGLKEQETDISELQRQLKIKTVEIDMLKDSINSLQAESKKFREEIDKGEQAKKELENARSKMKDLQRQIKVDANQTKAQLLLLKHQVSALQAKEEDAMRMAADVEKKMKAVRSLEMEIMELKRKNRELQHERRDLKVKLEAAQANVVVLANTTESDMVVKAREEVSNLRHTNEDLLKQVEGLQINRFSEVEELVYLRWVNACLRYELRNYQSPAGRLSARDLNKCLSPKSQEKAKQLMLEYADSERGLGDDVESNLSRPSSPGSEDIDNISLDSSPSRYNSYTKKSNFIQKFMKLTKSKDDSSTLSSPRSTGSPRRLSLSSDQRPKGPLESLMLRNVGDSVAITSFGIGNSSGPDSPESLVASSFQLMSKSVEGVLDQKYPAYKDRHMLALEREKRIKERAQKERAARFGNLTNFESTSKGEQVSSLSLPATLLQIKEKPVIFNSGDQASDGNDGESAKISKMKVSHVVDQRSPRVPRPPPKPSSDSPDSSAPVATTPSFPPTPPPPPNAPPVPPPPGSLPRARGSGHKVQRAPEVVELYQTLMKRESKKDTSLIAATSDITSMRSNMIGEIENRSSFLLAVKADVECQGDFVLSLASEVRAANFTNINDLVAFVNWLDEELSFLVDERAVLKHFDWPEGKTDALREAAFEYQDLKKLEHLMASFSDDPKLPCETALKAMYKMLEKVENSVYALLRTRDMAVSRYKDFGIPVAWLSDSGIVGKIKIASVQLARKYMKRVADQLDTLNAAEKEAEREFLVLQGVRFAFRVHQFAGGFDAESMKAFEELRSRVQQSQSQTVEVSNT